MALMLLSDIGKKTEIQEVKKKIQDLRSRINNSVNSHERLERIIILNDDWNVENGIITPTLKIKRNVIEKNYESKIKQWSLSKETIIVSENFVL
jgi:long-chain acyl-CoA synthetase